MDKKKLKEFQISSAIFTLILGTLLHFTYGWSGNNRLIGAFSAINESVWEHLKLLFFPMLITAIIGYFYIGKDVKNYLCAKTLGILAGMAFIVTFYYTYSGILGNNVAIIDIFSFIIGTVLVEYATYRLINSKIKCNRLLAIRVLVVFAVLFIVFTYNTPNLGIFEDPILQKVACMK